MTTTPQISAKDVAALRQQTGAGMMDCKRALEEAGGDVDKATEILRVKMGNQLGKLADREAAEGSATPDAESAVTPEAQTTETPTADDDTAAKPAPAADTEEAPAAEEAPAPEEAKS